jgi:anti-sigma regulatory factor (Ser/Thr protein kinase)
MFVRSSTDTFPTQTMSAVARLSEVRARFVEWLTRAGVGADQVDDLSVVLSELGANAIRETPEGAPPADVTARLRDDRLELTVTNEVSAESVPTDDWDLSDPLRTGGRGLLLVAAFVDDIDVDVEDRRLVVSCTVQL